MAEHRPFPPSARRRALARRAGQSAASPLAVGAIACAAAVLAASATGGAAAAQLGAWIAAACRGAGAGAGPADAGAVPSELAADAGAALAAAAAPRAVLALVLPVLAAAAGAAAIAHLAQTRALWLPRRRVAGAPALARGPIERTRRASFDLAAAAVVGGVAFGWLWSVAPRLAALPSVPLAGGALAAGGALVAGAAATLAIAWALLGAADALLRHADLARALRMSAHEQREDERLAGSDPRWRAYRAKAARAAPRAAIAGATVLVLGDDAAVAIAWDAVRRPIPTRTATGRAARATQLLGLARHHRIPVHRDPALAAALVGQGGPVPERHWARLADIIAAVRRS